MSITPLRKVTVYGFCEKKERVLDDLQSLGCIHVLPLKDQQPPPPGEGATAQLREALKFLLESPQMRHQVKDGSEFDAAAFEQEVLALKRQLGRLRDERDVVNKRLRDLQPWGDFHFAPLDEINGLRFWFYQVPHRHLAAIPSGLTWEAVSRDNRFVYVIVVAKEEPLAMPVRRTRTGAKSLSELTQRLDEIELAIEDLEVKRFASTRWSLQYLRCFDRLEDMAALNAVAGTTLDNDKLFALQGWVPVAHLEAVEHYAGQHGVVLDIRDPAPEEQPPTLFRNPPVAAAGQDLVTFYMTPGYWTWDPSSVVLISFAVFFAMILSDAGYALMLGLITLYVWPKMAGSEATRRLRIVFLSVVLTTFVYGVLTGSYFGIALPEDSPLMQLKLLDLTDASTMMLLSIGIGVVHVALGNFMNAYRLGLQPRALAPLGWAGLTVGGFLVYLGVQFDTPLLYTGEAVMAAGGVLVFAFSGVGSRPLTRLSLGALALTKITNAFGDVMSYLRLFALGLATASLAAAFNDMAMQIRDSRPGLGLVFALLVLVAGHGINFILGVMSAVVHGLRLNVIEFFNWGLKEEGDLFQAFQRKERAVWTTSS